MKLGRSLLRESFILSTLGTDSLRSLFLGAAVILSASAMANAAAGTEVNADAIAPAPDGVCDLYGDAFFYRPGTRNCVKTSGLAFLAQWRALLPAKGESGESLFAEHPSWGEAGYVYATPLLFAYTAPLGGGFSTLAVGHPFASAPGSDQATAGTKETSEIAGTIKLDEPWTASPFQGVVPQTLPGSESEANAGLQGNKNMIAAGDKLWLQAAFDKGPLKHATDDNLNWAYGSLNPAQPSAPVSPEGFDFGWNAQLPTDCVYTGVTAASAKCDKPWGGSMSGALKHYWAPDLSATVSGTSLSTDYDPKALEGFGGLVTPGDTQEATSMKGLDIGTQFMYLRLSQSNQAGHLADVIGTSPNAAGIPASKTNPSGNPAPGQNEGRIRVQRQF